MTVRVLLVTPRPPVADRVAAAIREAGFQCVISSDAAEAVDHFAASPFDALVLTLELREMGMLALLARFRELPAGHHLPVVALTSEYGTDLERLQSFAGPLGISAYLALPVDPGSLGRTLARLLGVAAPVSARAARIEVAAPVAPPAAGLDATLEALSRMSPREALGVPEEADFRVIRDAFFARVRGLHDEAARAPDEADRRAIQAVQAELQRMYLRLRAEVKAGGRASGPSEQVPDRPPTASLPDDPAASARPEATHTDAGSPGAGPPGDPMTASAAPEPREAVEAPVSSVSALSMGESGPRLQPRTGTIVGALPVRDPVPAAPADPVDAADLADVARMASIASDHGLAARLLQRALVKKPGDPGYRYRLILSLARKLTAAGQTEQARARYAEAIALAPDGVEARKELERLIPHSGSRRGADRLALILLERPEMG